MYLNTDYYWTTHTTGSPTANITRGKNRLKQYASTYYLRDGDNFEIELYNPKQTRVLAKIKLNGVPVSLGGIIVNPGQRVFLERFIESERKFQFSTYRVGETDTDQRAIEKNGDVEIEFFDEWSPNPSYGPINWTAGSNIFTNLTLTGANASIGTTYTQYRFNNPTLTSSGTFQKTTDASARKIETGRVEMGEKSNQVLETAHGSFYSWACANYRFKIIPGEEKIVDAGEIRNYCPGCGTRIKKSSWHFCPSCGEKLD
jgi:hypothetical protein